MRLMGISLFLSSFKQTCDLDKTTMRTCQKCLAKWRVFQPPVEVDSLMTSLLVFGLLGDDIFYSASRAIVEWGQTTQMDRYTLTYTGSTNSTAQHVIPADWGHSIKTKKTKRSSLVMLWSSSGSWELLSLLLNYHHLRLIFIWWDSGRNLHINVLFFHLIKLTSFLTSQCIIGLNPNVHPLDLQAETSPSAFWLLL